MSKPRMGATKRVAIGLLAGALAVFGIALAPSAGAVAQVTTDRAAGQTRFGTAGAACARAFPSGTGTVIVATARNFPDALAASSLAGANKACIFLTEVNTVPKETLDAITISKATKAIIVGGTAVVSDAVKTQLEAKGLTVSRTAGQNRFGTAAAILNAITPGSVAGAATCFIANGLNAADALSAGPGVYRGDGTNPFGLLLVTPDSIPAETQAALAKCKNAVVLGGTAAVSEAVRTQIATATGDTNVERVAGTDRFKTAVEIAKFLIQTLKTFPAPVTILLANGLPPTESFSVDALVGGPLGGQLQAVILLVQLDSLGADAQAFIEGASSTVTTIIAIGGTAVISQAVLDQAKAAGQKSAAGSASTRPELVSASIVSTTTTGQATATNPAGTVVAYTFDEPVNAVLAVANFKVYSAAGAPTTGAGGVASISTTDNRTVNVLFPAINTTALAGALTTATVVVGAVSDATGQQNPEGDAGVGQGGNSTLAAGTTTAPDLRTVAGFRGTTNPNTVAVDFTFDQAAYVNNTGGFHLVSVDGRLAPCTTPTINDSGNTLPSGQNVPGGNGTTTITVTCGQYPLTGTLAAVNPSSANTARGYVDALAVGSTPPAASTGVNGVTGAACGANNADATPLTNRCNPLEASDTPDQPSSTPDLVSATFKPATNTTSADEVDYTFDENVQTPTQAGAPVGNLFRVYFASTGTEQTGGTGAGLGACATGTPANCPAPQVSGNTVAVFFPNGTLANAVGASAAQGAVTAVAGAIPATNLADEVAVANSTATTVTPDKTIGPDLTAVALTSTTTGFTTTWSAAYVFDAPIVQSVAPPAAPPAGAPVTADFRLYLADGTQLICNAVVVATNSLNSAIPTNTAVCNSFVFGPAGQVGTNTPAGTPTQAQVGSAVLGTVTAGAVTGQNPAVTNPEGAEFTIGGNGTRTA